MFFFKRDIRAVYRCVCTRQVVFARHVPDRYFCSEQTSEQFTGVYVLDRWCSPGTVSVGIFIQYKHWTIPYYLCHAGHRCVCTRQMVFARHVFL